MADPDTPRADRRRYILAAVTALVGLVWLLQGAGAPIGRSFMIGDPVWLAAGAMLILASAAYAAWPRIRRR